MGKANVNLSDVSFFEQTINSQNQQINELCSHLRGQLSVYEEMISNEKQEINSVIEETSQGIVKLSSKIKELQEQLKTLEAELEATPPTIEVTITDEEGNETVVEEPNPAYEALQNKILEVEKKIASLEELKSILESLKEKANEQNNKLITALNKIEELTEQLNNNISNLSLICEEALSKLKDIQDVIQDYADTKIEAPDIGAFKNGIGGFFEKIKQKFKRRVSKENEPKTTLTEELTHDERRELNNYCGDGFSDINKLLRGKLNDSSSYHKDYIQKKVDIISDCLDKKVISNDMFVYRGIQEGKYILGEEFKSKSLEELKKEYIGKNYKDEGFSSTSTSFEIADRYSDTWTGIIMHVSVPKGAKGIVISNGIEQYDEKEVLLQKNTNYRYDDIRLLNNGKYLVEMTILKEE